MTVVSLLSLSSTHVTEYKLFIPADGDLKYEYVFRQSATRKQRPSRSPLSTELQKELIGRWYGRVYMQLYSLTHIVDMLNVTNRKLQRTNLKYTISEDDSSRNKKRATALQHRIKHHIDQMRIQTCNGKTNYVVCQKTHAGGYGRSHFRVFYNSILHRKTNGHRRVIQKIFLHILGSASGLRVCVDKLLPR